MHFVKSAFLQQRFHSFTVIMSGTIHTLLISTKWLFCRKEKLIKIVTCPPYQAHRTPLLVANNVWCVSEINVYIVGIIIYSYCNERVPNMFDGFFQCINELYDRNTIKCYELNVQLSRIDVRKFNLWYMVQNLEWYSYVYKTCDICKCI